MVGVYYLWEYIVNMCDSIKTGIISDASKNGDYVKKNLKISHQQNLNSRINYDETAGTQRKFIQYSFFRIELMFPTHLTKLY